MPPLLSVVLLAVPPLTRIDGDCNGRVVRGGSWDDSEVEHRSAARTGGYKQDQFYTDGLRSARGI
jgi:formylglycine-generating enzyme required for sulfatase activity